MKTVRRAYTNEHSLYGYMRKLVVAMMERDGRDFGYCEVGKHEIINGKFDIHHEKYDGATYYDLKICCRKHNNAPENRHLA